MRYFFDRKNFHTIGVCAWLGCSLYLVTLSTLADEVDGPVYELSPFEVMVGDDRGYRATNTTAGTSLNVNVRDLPMNVDIVTRELIEDLGATDMREALSYSAGVFIESFQNTNANPFESQDRSPSSSVQLGGEFNNSISIRGYNVPNQQRMGFRIGALVPAYGVVLGGNTDAVNTARQEVVRGPQSLLYGINVLSGVVNIIPQQPLSESRTWVNATVGSYYFYRFTLNNTGPLIRDRLNYRVMTAQDDRGNWREHLKHEREYYAGQLDWFINRNHKLFIEAQYTDMVRKGGGALFLRDGSSTIDDFRNPWNERYSFGRDFFNEQVIDPERFNNVSDSFGPVSGRPFLIQRTDREYDFPDLGERFRITGPDTRRWETEKNLLLLYTGKLTENLYAEAGAYFTRTDILERLVNLRTVVTDTSFNPSGSGGNAWTMNPEVAPYWNHSANQPLDPDNWRIGWGPGEFFIRDDPLEDAFVPIENRIYAAYMWFERPTNSRSDQYRGRLAYDFETDGWNGRLRGAHTISGGINYIKDRVHFVQGGANLADNYALGDGALNYVDSRFDNDAVYLRSSIFDYTPLRFTDDTNLALIGRYSYARLGEDYEAGLDSALARSGWMDVDLWFRGLYSVYHGRFWNDRMHLIAGIRQDRYQVKEAEHLRILDNYRETDFWTGGNPHRRGTPFLAGYGDRPYQWNPELPDSLNQRVESSMVRINEARPMGTVDYNFETAEKYTTKTFGLNYRISDAYSAYYFYSEGIFPNTGQRDGAHRAIEAEQTRSNEVGVKFDLFGGKLSGQVSVFRIERKNAVWFWAEAPNPARWLGGPNSEHTDVTRFERAFSPDAIREGMVTRRYGVQQKYVIEAYEQLGLPLPFVPGRPGVIHLAQMRDYGAFDNQSSPVGPRNERVPFIWADYEVMVANDSPDSPNPIRLAFDLAMQDKETFDPLMWQYGSADTLGYNASRGTAANRGANVRFEEVGEGIDGNLIYSPTPNYQIIFNYSYQKRRVAGAGFILAPGYQLDQDGNQVDDVLWTTEYDRWVFVLGPENFADPRDPTTLQGGSINGIDLSFVPRWSFRLWNKYQFMDGWLEGVEIGAGIRGNGSTTTTLPIGGRNMTFNAYPTPDMPQRIFGDAMISYRFNAWNIRWTVRLNAYNLFVSQITNREVSYEGVDGRTELRRTRVVHDPRYFRISVGAQF